MGASPLPEDERSVLDAAFSHRASLYLTAARDQVKGSSGRDIADRVEALVTGHDEWRLNCLNLNPAEGLMSERCKRTLASDMATRLSEGIPGDKIYPHGKQNLYIDEIEAICIALVQEQFGADYVEWRPISTNMANGIVFFGLLERGDVILAQAESGGGNYSYHRHGQAGLAGLDIRDIPTVGQAFEIDLDYVRDASKRVHPKMIVVGGSNVLFPYPVGELRTIADEVGAILLYDAAHLGLLNWTGSFQRPLVEGAHLMTCSTVKAVGGPVGGLILTNDLSLYKRISKIVFPAFVQKRDQNKYAALAVSLAEMSEFGPRLAKQMIRNAQALARELERRGFVAVGSDRSYTRTHQVFLDVGADAQKLEQRCQEANILFSDCALTGSYPWKNRCGARLATHEITRLGMVEVDVQVVAELIHRAFEGDEPNLLREEVSRLRETFRNVQLSFDG